VVIGPGHLNQIHLRLALDIIRPRVSIKHDGAQDLLPAADYLPDGLAEASRKEFHFPDFVNDNQIRLPGGTLKDGHTNPVQAIHINPVLAYPVPAGSPDMSQHRFLPVYGDQSETEPRALTPYFLGVKATSAAFNPGHYLPDKTGLPSPRPAGKQINWLHRQQLPTTFTRYGQLFLGFLLRLSSFLQLLMPAPMFKSGHPSALIHNRNITQINFFCHFWR